MDFSDPFLDSETDDPAPVRNNPPRAASLPPAGPDDIELEPLSPETTDEEQYEEPEPSNDLDLQLQSYQDEMAPGAPPPRRPPPPPPPPRGTPSTSRAPARQQAPLAEDTLDEALELESLSAGNYREPRRPSGEPERDQNGRPLYFTSTNTSRYKRKKKVVNPKLQKKEGFFSRMFGKKK